MQFNTAAQANQVWASHKIVVRSTWRNYQQQALKGHSRRMPYAIAEVMAGYEPLIRHRLGIRPFWSEEALAWQEV